METQLREEIEKIEKDIFNEKNIDIKRLYEIKKVCIHRKYTDLIELLNFLEVILDKRDNQLLNKRLNILTVWSTIFLPLSFYTGLWGMNFDDIPLVTDDYGFWVFLFLSIITVYSMWSYFKRNKWL